MLAMDSLKMKFKSYYTCNSIKNATLKNKGENVLEIMVSCREHG